MQIQIPNNLDVPPPILPYVNIIAAELMNAAYERASSGKTSTTARRVYRDMTFNNGLNDMFVRHLTNAISLLFLKCRTIQNYQIQNDIRLVATSVCQMISAMETLENPNELGEIQRDPNAQQKLNMLQQRANEFMAVGQQIQAMSMQQTAYAAPAPQPAYQQPYQQQPYQHQAPMHQGGYPAPQPQYVGGNPNYSQSGHQAAFANHAPRHSPHPPQQITPHVQPHPQQFNANESPRERIKRLAAEARQNGVATPAAIRVEPKPVANVPNPALNEIRAIPVPRGNETIVTKVETPLDIVGDADSFRKGTRALTPLDTGLDKTRSLVETVSVDLKEHRCGKYLTSMTFLGAQATASIQSALSRAKEVQLFDDFVAEIDLENEQLRENGLTAVESSLYEPAVYIESPFDTSISLSRKELTYDMFEYLKANMPESAALDVDNTTVMFSTRCRLPIDSLVELLYKEINDFITLDLDVLDSKSKPELLSNVVLEFQRRLSGALSDTDYAYLCARLTQMANRQVQVVYGVTSLTKIDDYVSDVLELYRHMAEEWSNINLVTLTKEIYSQTFSNVSVVDVVDEDGKIIEGEKYYEFYQVTAYLLLPLYSDKIQLTHKGNCGVVEKSKYPDLCDTIDRMYTLYPTAGSFVLTTHDCIKMSLFKLNDMYLISPL